MPLCHRQFRMQMSGTAVRPRSTRITINNDQRANYRPADFSARRVRTYARRKERQTDRPTSLPRPLPVPLPFRLIVASLPRFFFNFSSLEARYMHMRIHGLLRARMYVPVRRVDIPRVMHVYGTLFR